jgi:hypothetical protein
MRQSSKVLVIIAAVFSILFCACSTPEKPSPTIDTVNEKKLIIAMLDSFNLAAAKADFKAYFNFYTDDAIFTGTDATERWDKAAFMTWAKPIFDKGRAWGFKALERNIYFDKTGSIAWFDELLNTQMKICRGSGVLVKEGDSWKLKQYILSTTIPNDQIDSVISLKSHVEDSIIHALEKK